jgi:hypothetical protein
MVTVHMCTDVLMTAQEPKGVCWEIKLLVIAVYLVSYFFFFGATAPIGPWPTSMKLSVSLRFSRS